MAASEFALSPKTVSQRMKQSGALPGADKRFSTFQIHTAICGDYERERTRKMKEEADRRALDNAKSRGSLVEIVDFLKRYERVCSGMRQRIMSSGLADAEKDALLGELAGLHFS